MTKFEVRTSNVYSHETLEEQDFAGAVDAFVGGGGGVGSGHGGRGDQMAVSD